MESMLKVLEKLKQQSIIEDYALGGATALLFYTEPANTEDVDIFIFLPNNTSQNLLIDFGPLYENLKKQGYFSDSIYINIEGFKVQFLPAYNDLVIEAVKKATLKNYAKTKTRVLSLEYLMAIMVDTNRPKDWARLAELIEKNQFDRAQFLQILKNHNLTQKWERILERIQ